MLSILDLIECERLLGPQSVLATEMTGSFSGDGGLEMKTVAEVPGLVDNMR